MKKKKLFLNPFLIGAFLFAISSCEKDKTPPPEENTEPVSTELLMEEKNLAEVILENGLKVQFRTEVDGVVYEELFENEQQSTTLVQLRELSILERFLILTDENIAVPEDLITIEEDESIKEKALERGTLIKHDELIRSSVDVKEFTGFDRGIECSPPAAYSNTDASGTYYRTFRYYLAGASKSIVYSSSKSGANRCKTICFLLNKCGTIGAGYSIKAKTFYKPFGFYVHQNTVSVPASFYGTFWCKTYVLKHYRRVNVEQGYPGGDDRFGGYVQFKNY